MADAQLIKVFRGSENGGVTKWVKPKDLAKSKAAGYVVATEAAVEKKPAAKPASTKASDK
jgi:hypothetical protein